MADTTGRTNDCKEDGNDRHGELRCVCKEDAARIFDNILTGHATPAQTQCVIVNAAFAIQVMEPQKEIEECIAIARESLDSGRALATLKKFIEINK